MTRFGGYLPPFAESGKEKPVNPATIAHEMYLGEMYLG
jgi:hypothetical protein